MTLDRDSRQAFHAAHPDWTADGEIITRTFSFPDFAQAIGFAAAVGVLAEKAFHHPDIDIRYNRVTLALTTHDQGGLTEKDTALAAQIDQLFQ